MHNEIAYKITHRNFSVLFIHILKYAPYKDLNEK